MPREFMSCGRELTIRFQCARCKRTTVEPYREVMKGEHYDYLSNSSLPEGWANLDTFRILCDECIGKFKEFMEGS